MDEKTNSRFWRLWNTFILKQARMTENQRQLLKHRESFQDAITQESENQI